MSTSRTTTTTSQYDPSSMGMFRQFQPTIGAGLMDYAQDPMKATYFNRQVQMMNLQNAGYANQANQQLMMNQRVFGGMSNPNAFMASQLARNQRAAQARSSQGFNQLLMQANQVRMGALGQMQGYRPLQIGQTSKESTGGLGSWLSPLIGAGVGAGLSMIPGLGKMSLGGPMGGGGYASASSGPMASRGGPGMQDVSGGAFGEGQYNPYLAR